MPEAFNKRCPRCGHPGGYINCSNCQTGRDLSIRDPEHIYEAYAEDPQAEATYLGRAPGEQATEGASEGREATQEQGSEEG